MNSFHFFAVLLSLGVLCAQTPQPATPKPKPESAPKPTKPGPKPAVVPKPDESPTPAEKPGSSTATSQVPDDKVVLSFGGEKVTAREFETFIEALPPQYQAQARGPMKRQIAEQLVRVRLLAEEARRRGLDDEAATKARIEFQTDNLLAGALFNQIQQDVKVDEEALKKYYEENKAEFQQAEARHILIKFKGSPVPSKEGKTELTEEEALAKVKEIRQRLVSGEDFAKIAKEESDDIGSGAAGGSLGTFKPGTMVPAFEEAVFSLPVGTVSEPVKTQFGYHLIEVQSRDARSFEEVREDIESKLKPELARKAVEGIRGEAAATFDEAYFGPETAPMPGMPGPAPGATPNRPATPVQPGTVAPKVLQPKPAQPK